MPELTLHHIDQISSDISRQEIVFSHLLHDLIDHVCCDVENEMQNGLSFSEAYRKVKQKMGSRRLKEIQEETLYSVDTKYRQMKNTMKISGIAGTLMLGFASIFKIMHWPGAAVLLIAGAFTLAFIFLPSALGILWKETHSSKRLFLYISAFFTGLFFLMGILFKVQHWPGASIILTVGAITTIFLFIPALTVSRFRDPESKSKHGIYIAGAAGLIFLIAGMLCKIMHWPFAAFFIMLSIVDLFFVVLPWYTWKSWRKEENVTAMFIYLIIGTVLLVVPAAMISLNVQRNFAEGYYYHQQQEQALYSYLQENTRSVLAEHNDSQAFPIMEQLHSRTNDLIKSINAIELKMVALAEGKKDQPVSDPVQVKQTATGQEVDFNLIHDAFSHEPVSTYLFPGTEGRMELEKAMADYRNYVTGLDSLHLNVNLSIVADPSAYLPADPEENERITMMTGLHSLALLRNAILAFETKALTEIAGR
jgi:hypothetical protein